MTDPTAPLSDDDLSAHLDGQADPSVAARIAADPAARARLDQLARARDLAATPVVTPSARQVDALIAGALDAGAGVDPLAPVAPLRRAGRPQAPRWLAAAAAIVLVLGVGLIIRGLGGSGTRSNDLASSTAADQADQSSTKANAVPESSAAHGSGSSSAGATDHDAIKAYADAAAAALDLGVFTDDDALRAALRTSWPTDPAPVTDQSGVAADDRSAERIARCATQVQTVLRLTTAPTEVGYAKIGNRPVLVFQFAGPSFKNGSPTTIVTAADPVACNPVLTFER